KHLGDPHHAVVRCAQLLNQPLDLVLDLTSIRRTRAEDQLDVWWQLSYRPEQMRQPLLARLAADVDDRREVRVDTVRAQQPPIDARRPSIGGDTVAYDGDVVRVDLRITTQHVLAHRIAHRDHAIRGFVGLPLDPRTDRVSPAELLGLPR